MLQCAEDVKDHHSKVFKVAALNRDNIMMKAKIRNDRQIRKFDYDFGDLVLWTIRDFK